MKSYAELIEQANIKFPVAAHKTTVYSVLGKTAEAGIDWVATTNTTVHKLAYGLEEQDEARAKLIALALNYHEEMVAALEHSAASIHHPACKCRGERTANPERYCTCHVYKAQAVLDKLKHKS